jgi:hypothetical protein
MMDCCEVCIMEELSGWEVKEGCLVSKEGMGIEVAVFACMLDSDGDVKEELRPGRILSVATRYVV